MRVILTAAGAMRRWTVNGELYGGVPKHLIPIKGEPLIHRNVRMFSPHADVVVVGPPDPRYQIEGSTLFVPTHHVPWVDAPKRHDADKFLSSRELWNEDGRTVIVHGDTYLTRKAARLIVSYEGEWCLFARYKRHAPPFHKLETMALSFNPSEHAAFDAALERIVSLQEDGDIPRSGTWDLYRALRGADVDELRKIKRLHSHTIDPAHSVELPPPNTDIDKPPEYEGLVRHLSR